MPESGTKRPGRPRDEALTARRQEEILDAAAKIFADRGYATTDLQVLADELGVGKGTIYRYFATKQDLFLATVDRGMRRLSEEIHTTKACMSDSIDNMLQVVRAYLAFFDAHPEMVELIIQERAVFKDRKKPTYFEHRDAALGDRRQHLRALITQGCLRDIPVDRIIDVINNLLYGTIVTNYFTGNSRPLEQQARDIVDIVFHGILSEPERKRRIDGAVTAETAE